MKKKGMLIHSIVLFIVLVTGSYLNAQIVIASSTNDPKTILEVFSDQQRDSMKNVTEGRVILNANTNCINYYSKGNWFSLCGTCLPETPKVKIDSVVYLKGKLGVYFDEQKATDENIEQFIIKISPLNWAFKINHSPFTIDVELDSTYTTISIAGIGKCGVGKEEQVDSILVYTYHPCEGQRSLVDPRDGHQYELVEIGSQCWIRGYLKFIPNIKGAYLNEKEAVFYEWNNFSKPENNFCPSGFHVPSKVEADLFADIVDNSYNQYSTQESYDKRVKDFGVEYIGGFDNKKTRSFKGGSDFFWVQEFKDKQDAYLGLIVPKATMITVAPRNSYMPIRCIKD